MAKNKGQKTDPHKYTWAKAFADVSIRSMSIGQFPIFLIFVFLMTILFTMPPEEVGVLAHRVFDLFSNYVLFAYVLNVILVVAWFAQARWARKRFHEEMARIGREKSQLQNLLVNKKFKSSER